jgi:hypothetical protein
MPLTSRFPPRPIQFGSSSLSRMLRVCLLLSLACTTAIQAEQPALITRVFKWPADYSLRDWPYDEPNRDVFEDGPAIFYRSSSPAPLPPRKIVRDFLEKQGVTFPEGTSATFNLHTGLLSVTNTQPNVQTVEALAESFARTAPATIICTVTVIEGPMELIHQANAAATRTTNAAQELQTLLGYARNPGSNVRIVGDAFLETKPGTRTTALAVREHTYAAGLEMDAKSRSSVVHETREIGLRLEYEPTLGSDGETIESSVALELHPAPPVERQVSISEPLSGGSAVFPVTDISAAKFITGFSSKAGSTKFLGITKPVGKSGQSEVTLWAAFLTLNVRRVEYQPTLEAAPHAQNMLESSSLRTMAFKVPDGLFAPFMENDQISQSQSEPWLFRKPLPLQTWLEARGVKSVKGASAEHSNGVLTVTNTADNIERIASLTEECLRNSGKTLAFTLHTIQAPAAFLRDQAHKTTRSADDTAMLAAAEAAVGRGEACFINSLYFEPKSGTQASLHSVIEHSHLSKFRTDAKGRPSIDFAIRPVGSILQIEPTLGTNGSLVDISLQHEFHGAAPEAHREHFHDPSSGKPFEMSIDDFHTASTITGICMSSGGTKLISLSRPTYEDSDVLQATFLKCALVRQIASPPQAAAEKEKKKSAPLDPKSWNTRMYHVPPDFLSSGGEPPAANGLVQRMTAVGILEAAGIPFPKDATASYNHATSVLFVKNTNENLAKVDAYIESITKTAPKILVFTTHVLQAPGPLLRRLTSQAAMKSDHRAELDELLAAFKSVSVQHLNTARVETKSGTRATSKQAIEHTFIKGITLNDKSEPVFEQDTRGSGLQVEFEPTVGADGTTIELTLSAEYHTAPPLEHREHLIDTQGRRLEFPLTDYFTSKTTTGITIPSGSARLLSLYKPTSKPEFEKEGLRYIGWVKGAGTLRSRSPAIQ